MVLLTLVWTRLCPAQTGLPLSHQSWSTDEGLPDASVHAILQARDGYLWVATEGGIARFDGSEFVIYSHATQPVITEDDVRALAQDSAGDLWFGTVDGLLRLHGSTWQRFTTQYGLPSNRILSVAASRDGALLVLTAYGLAQRQGSRFSPLSVGGAHPLALRSESDGTLSVRTQGDPLVYARGALHSVPEKKLAANRLGQGGPAWTYTAGTLSLGGPGPSRSLRVVRDFAATRITTVEADTADRIWLGTNRGLLLLSAENTVSPQPVPQLNSDVILSLCRDREGNLWIGTESSGLHILRPRKFRAETGSAGEAVTAVHGEAADAAWFGTRDSGLQRVQHGVVSLPVPASSLASPVILSLASGRNGERWIGTPDGLNHLSYGGVQNFTSADGLPDDFIRTLLVDRHGTVWAGTRGGLARIEAGRITVRTAADGLGSDSIGPLLEPSGNAGNAAEDNLWVGTSKGLSHLMGSRIETFAPASQEHGIVTALAQFDEQSLLVAVHGAGLFVFARGAFSPLPLPLPSDVTSMVVDRTGALWLRGTHGLYRSSLEKLHRCLARTVRCRSAVQAITTADGLPSEVAGDGAPQLSLTPEGSLWVATRKGLAVADTLHLPVNEIAPPVVIQHFSVDGTEVPLASGPASFAPGHSRFLFNFAALSYTLPAKVRYRYKLDGFDRDWIDAGPLRSASYTSLPPRHYRFLVQAQNNDGVWDTQDAALGFRILPPLYRRWWFALLLLLLLAAATLFIVQLRERVMRRRFSVVLGERNRLAREIHDTLAQDFVSISLQLDLASNLLKNKQVEAATEQLQDIRSLIKEGLQAARQSIWNLRASAGEDSLPTRLSALVQRYPFGEGPPKLSIGGAFRKLPATLEAEVLRIAQESLSNVHRHAEATEVSVGLFYHPEELQLTVKDNGRGFTPVEAHSRQGHYGLRGLRERADTIGGALMIASDPGKGTTVSLTVPLGKESTAA